MEELEEIPPHSPTCKVCHGQCWKEEKCDFCGKQDFDCICDDESPKPKENWREKISRARGYNMDAGDTFLVFEKENEIWNAQDLKEYIATLLQSQREEAIKEEAKGSREWYYQLQRRNK